MIKPKAFFIKDLISLFIPGCFDHENIEFYEITTKTKVLVHPD